MEHLYTQWNTCIRNGTLVYKMEHLYKKWNTCIQNGTLV